MTPPESQLKRVNEKLVLLLRQYQLLQKENERLKEDLKNRRQPLKGVEFWMNSRTRVGGG